MMVISASRQENRSITVSLGHLKSKYAGVEAECRFEVSNFQVNVSNSYARVNGRRCGCGIVLGNSHNRTP